MITHDFKSDYPVSLLHTVHSHGWVQLPPWKWDHSSKTLSRIDPISNNRLTRISVSQVGTKLFRLRVDSQCIHAKELDRILFTVKRWLSLDWDPSDAILVSAPLDPNVSLFIKQGGGRFLRCSTFYEDLAKTICTINTNWKSTIRMCSQLVKGLGLNSFPKPKIVMAAGPLILSQQLKLGFRSRILFDATVSLLQREIIDEDGNLIDRTLNTDALLSLKGIGEYSANHIMMLSNNFKYIPIDSEVSKYFQTRYKVQPPHIQNVFNAWGPYKFLGYKITRMFDNQGGATLVPNR